MTNPINSDQVRQALLAGAVAKLAKGGASKLTPEERKVLATVSPDFAEPVPGAATSAPDPSAPASVSAIAPAQAVVRKFTGGRLKYEHDYAHYAQVLGVGLRTIKRWCAIGKKKNDLCPLDDLAQLHAWWTRCQTYDAPTEVVNAAASAARANSETAGQSAGEQVASSSGATTVEGKGAAAGANPPTSPGKPLVASDRMQVISLEENLERVSRQHRANLDLLDEAYAGNSESGLTARLRNARASGEMLKDAQKALDEFRAARGDMVPIAEVQDEGRRVHTAMAHSLLNVIVELGVPRVRAERAVDDWFLQLRESNFFADTMPTLALASAQPIVPSPVPASAP